MPPRGAPARGAAHGTLQRLHHDRLVAPELGALLDAAGPEDALLVRSVRREHDRATRVPGALTETMARTGSAGYQVWLQAREANDFAVLRARAAAQHRARSRVRRLLPGVRAPLRRAPGPLRAGRDGGRRLGALHAAARRARAAAEQDRAAPRPARPARRLPGRRPARARPADRHGDGLRSRRLAHRRRRPPVRRLAVGGATSASPRASTTTASPACSRSCTRPATGSTSTASTRRSRARRSTAASRSASTSPRAGCGRTSSAAARRSGATGCRACASASR